MPNGKKNGFDPHEVKEVAKGTSRNGSKFDNYVDKDTGQLWVFGKGGKMLVFLLENI